MKAKGLLFPAFAIFFLWPSNIAFGHDVAEHLDPELLTGWRTGLHLSIQWAHLVAFALWLGLTMGTLLLGIKPSLDQLLYSSWILFLVFLATGTYNMEWSAGISETPSLLLLPLLERIPHGVTYTVVLAIKVALYSLAVLLMLVITLLHLRRVDEIRLRKAFLFWGTALALAISFMATVVLFYHEVGDLWPTPVHSLGGVMAPEGPQGQALASTPTSPPNDFHLLRTRGAWIDIVLRWIHLLGFGLLLGGATAGAILRGVSPRRFLLCSWILLVIQVMSGMGSMGRWAPFSVSPYPWNLSALSQVRFGRTYTLFMTAKQVLVIILVGLMLAATYRYLKSDRRQEAGMASLRIYLALEIFLGLAIAYIMMVVLLLHEGVDHAL